MLPKISRTLLAYAAGAITAFVGIIVLIGWQFDIASLKSFFPGTVTMKPNTAALFLLSGISLIFLQRPSPSGNALARFCAVIIALTGLLSLAQYLFGWDIGLDELLFREPSGTIGTLHPGLMAPNTALNFILLGFAFFLLTLNRLWRNFLTEFSIIFSLSISIIGLSGYLTGLIELAGPAIYTKMAANTAFTFIILCLGILFTVVERQQKPITIEQKFFAGLTVSVTVILFISLLSISGIQSLRVASGRVGYTQQVKNQLEAIVSNVLEVQSGGRGFVITGNEEYLVPYKEASRDLPARINNLRLQIADNPDQQRALAALEKLVEERIAFSDELVSTRRLKGEKEARLLIETDKGNSLTNRIRMLITNMIEKEDRLLQSRNKAENEQTLRTRFIIFLSLGVQMLLLAFIFVLVKRELAGRKKAKEALLRMNQELEDRVTERTKSLVESEERFGKAFRSSPVGMGIFRMSNNQAMEVNDGWSQLFGYSRAEALGHTAIELGIIDAETRQQMIDEVRVKGMVRNLEVRMRNRAGEQRNVLLSMENMNLNGEMCVVTTGIDITERKKAEEEIKKINRIYTVLSNINHTIVRVNDKQTLYDEACRIAVDDGKFRMAWIGMVDLQTNKVNPVASAGFTGDYLKTINLDLNDEKLRQGQTGRAIKTGIHYFANDIANDPDMMPWHENALRHGYKSSAAFPIHVFGKTIGAFMFYSDEQFFFDAAEVKLIDELAMDISFAIEVNENEAIRKHSEEVLKESEERMRIAVEAADLGTWDLDLATDTAVRSLRHDQCFGYSELQPKWGLEIAMLHMLPEDQPMVASAFAHAMETGELTFETRVKWPDGSIHWIAANGRLNRNSEGLPVRLSGVVADITNRKLAEEEIRNMNASLELKVEERTKELSELNRNLEIEIAEKTRLAHQLEVKQIELQAHNEELQQTQLALNEAHEKYFDLYMLAPVGYLTVSDQGIILEANLLAANLFGAKIEHVKDKPVNQFICESDHDIFHLHRNSLHETGKKQSFEIRMKKTNGTEFWAQVESILSSGLDDNTNCSITISDITERKKIEEELSKAKAEAERTNLAKSEFLSRMSHELRTPMNSILGFAQLMDMGELKPAHKKGVDHILKSGKHLLDLINEVLDLSRIEAGKLTISLEPVQFCGIVSETLDIVHPLAAEKNISLEFPESMVNNFHIKADRQKLRQVLLNLVNNAVKYNREGGAVKVECSEQTAVGSPKLAVGNQQSTVGGQQPATGSPQSATGSRQQTEDFGLKTEDRGLKTVRISVTDTGKGIASDQIQKLFNPFQRIGNEISEVEGTGLGLAVAKKLIEAMHGTIGVESEVGVGSTFWIELPQTEGQIDRNERLSGQVVPEQENALVSGTILYIEDNISNIQLVEQIIGAHRPSIRLITEMYGKNAVKLASDYKPDLILLDLDLPDIHGSEVLALLQENERTKFIPVVIISADAMGSQIEKLMQAGAKDYLTKPLDVLEFLRVVEEVTGKK